MKILEFLTREPHGCCNVSELLALSREDRANGTNHVEDLKRYAREEMANKNITVEN